MSWNTPKVNWTTDDGIGTADLNRIEGDIQILKCGGDNGASIASANNLTINKNYHLVTYGVAAIMYMSTTGWLPGATVVLTFPSGIVLHHVESLSPPANHAPLWIVKGDGTNGDATTRPSIQTVKFLYDGTYWRIVGAIQQ